MVEKGIDMESLHRKDSMKEKHPYYDGMELAQAYVPFQKLDRIYNPEDGLCKGTIFPELYRPYEAYKKDCSKCR